MIVAAIFVSTLLALTLPPSYAPTPSASAEATNNPPSEDARKAFVAGRAAFARGEYRRAAEYFALAQRVFPHPNTMYNLALALEASGQAREAWWNYMAVAREAANPADRDDARIRADHLLDRLALVRFHATSTQQVCLAGHAPVPDPSTPGWFSAVVEPGEHALTIGDVRRNILLRGATEYEFHLALRRQEPPEIRRRTRNLAVASVLSGALSLGLQGVALALGSNLNTERRTVQLSGIGVGGAAIGLGIGAWRVHRRSLDQAESQDAAVALVCPAQLPTEANP
jgi:hypothetical protein